MGSALEISEKKLGKKTDHVGRVFAGQCACVSVSQREKRRNRKSLVGV